MRSATTIRVVNGPTIGPPRYPGEVVAYVASATLGIEWLFRHSGDNSAFPWRALGPAPLISEVPAAETTVSAAYAALATAGPSLTPPLSGDYIVHQEAQVSVNGVGRTNMSYDIGASGAGDGDSFQIVIDVANNEKDGQRTRRKTNLVGGQAIVSKYKTSANTANFSQRMLSIQPLRCA